MQDCFRDHSVVTSCSPSQGSIAVLIRVMCCGFVDELNKTDQPANSLAINSTRHRQCDIIAWIRSPIKVETNQINHAFNYTRWRCLYNLQSIGTCSRRATNIIPRTSTAAIPGGGRGEGGEGRVISRRDFHGGYHGRAISGASRDCSCPAGGKNELLTFIVRLRSSFHGRSVYRSPLYLSIRVSVNEQSAFCTPGVVLCPP